MQKIEPLTASERLYAEKHHDLVYQFSVTLQTMKEDEYYDIIILWISCSYSGISKGSRTAVLSIFYDCLEENVLGLSAKSHLYKSSEKKSSDGYLPGRFPY